MLIANCGRRGTGKTTLGAYMIDRRPRRAAIETRPLIRRPGAVVIRSAARLGELFDALAEGDIDELVFSPTDTDHAKAFDVFVAQLRRWCLEYPALELGVLIDESRMYGEIDRSKTFMWLMKSCDPALIDLVLTSHRPANLPTEVRALLNRWCLFRTTQEHDLKAIAEHCTADVVDLVKELPGREYVAWNDDDGTYEVNRAPCIWQTDLRPAGAEASILVIP